jgi:penicillin amidase
LPHVYNPPDGIILSANNKPVPDTYTHKLTYHWIEMPYRAIRLSELIKNHGDKFDVNAMIKIQSDTKNYLWDDLKPILLQTIPLDALSLKGLEVLKNWDGAFKFIKPHIYY